MFTIEQTVIQFLMNFFTREEINAFFRSPQNTATIIGCLIAISGALLGTFLLLRGMSLTTDAISHTILLGIVVAFLVMVNLFRLEPDLSSPWLLIGAAGAGVATVILTELINRSGLVKQDAALGLAFPLLFAVSIILISRYASDVHLDVHSVTVGEVGIAWANTNSHCIENCETIVITPESESAKITRQCTNCSTNGINPRDPEAEFTEICANCGTYTPAQAWQAGLVENEPVLVFWPKAITVMSVMAILTVGFVVLFFKELKLTTFDAALAKSLGFRPGLINYALMVLVSLVAVGAFDAVGSILVIAFFIIPPAAAYLLTDRLSLMLILSPIIGGLGTYFGYDLARGNFLGLIQIPDVIATINRVFGTDLLEAWDSSISASMVLMIFFFFVLAWVMSPKYGLISTFVRRANQRRRFNDQVVLGHIYNHQHTDVAAQELAADDLYRHFRWTKTKMGRVLARLRAAQLVQVANDLVTLTPRGEERVETFREQNLSTASN
jgi:manganese/zinc/iron transport system permease protein